MTLPFTPEEFLGVFTQYNAFAWPASILAYVLAALVIVAVIKEWRTAPQFLFAALALMWAWTGIFYHMGYFSVINTAAWAFGILFLIGATVFVWQIRGHVSAQAAAWIGWTSALGWVLIAYSMIAYPVIGLALGHRYMDIPQFGVTPCPVTLFTFGSLLLFRGTLPWSVLAAPVLWSLIGGSAAFLLGVLQDWLLLFSGILTIAAILASRRAIA